MAARMDLARIMASETKIYELYDQDALELDARESAAAWSLAVERYKDVPACHHRHTGESMLAGLKDAILESAFKSIFGTTP